MAEDGEPLCKKTKLDKSPVTKEQIDLIRSRLSVHTHYVYAIDNHFVESSQPRFSFLKIVDSNAQNSICFSSAWCKNQHNFDSASIEHRFLLPFRQLFNVELVYDVLHEQDARTVLVGEKQFRALVKLDHFLHNKSDDADKLWKTSQVNNLKQVDWAKVICAHLVSKLAVSDDVTLDDGYLTSSGKHCPCKCGTELVFHDNSIGHEDVWHGSVDMLVGRSTVVTCSVDGDTGVSVLGSSHSGDGMSKVENVSYDQVLAETIVFSLTQRDRDFTPTLLITKDDMRVYIYEKKHDLLLESPPIEIFKGTSLNPVFVLSLWFTLNYNYFTDDRLFLGLKPDEKFLYHADFFKDMLERKQATYKQHLRLTGCKNVRTVKETRMKWSDSWGAIIPESAFRKKLRKNNFQPQQPQLQESLGI